MSRQDRSDEDKGPPLSRRQFVVGSAAVAAAGALGQGHGAGGRPAGARYEQNAPPAAEADPSAGIQHSAEQRYELFKQHLALRGNAITDRQFDGIDGREPWEQRRPQVYRQFMDALGLDPLPQRTPLNARITGGFQRDGYRVENISFQSLPGFHVNGNLYIPDSAQNAPAPTVLYVCGHSPGPVGAKAAYQQRGIWFAQNGFVCFVIDTIEFGEIPGIHHGLHDLEMWYWLSLNYTPAGPEVWNAMRALDYLQTRPEVDADRFAVTGVSGGGAISWFTAAADDRIKVAAPALGTWTVGPHVADDRVWHNCDCIYFWNNGELDLPIVGALIAPRPLMIVNARRDGAFPPIGYEPVSQKLRRVYGWYDAADRIDDFERDTPHNYIPAYKKAASEWIARWLTGDVIGYDEAAQLPEEEHANLRVLDRYPANARNFGIERTFIRTHELHRPRTLAEWERRREELLGRLHERVYRQFPRQRVPFGTWKAPIHNWAERYCEPHHVEFTTEQSIRVHGQLFVPRSPGPHPALVHIRAGNEMVWSVDYDNILAAMGNHVILVLHPRAVDYGMTNLQRIAAGMSGGLLGITIETMQLWDALRAIDFLEQDQNLALSGVSVYGRREMAALAIHAGAIDQRISRVIVEDPPRSHWQAPPLMNVLRITDLCEVAGLLAPRELVSVGELPSTFDHARAVFALYDQEEHVRQANSLCDALRVWEYA